MPSSVFVHGRPYTISGGQIPNEADNHLVELAVAGRAEVIVTWNTQDFQRAELRFHGLRIVRPNDFLEEDGADDNPDDSLA